MVMRISGKAGVREGRRSTWASPLSRHQELTPFPQEGLEKQGQGSFWLIERPRELPTFLKCSTATIKQQSPRCLFKPTLPEIGSPKPSVPQSHLQKCTWSSLSHTGNPIAWASVGKNEWITMDKNECRKIFHPTPSYVITLHWVGPLALALNSSFPVLSSFLF